MIVILDWFCHWDKEQAGFMQRPEELLRMESLLLGAGLRSQFHNARCPGNKKNLHGNDPEPFDLTIALTPAPSQTQPPRMSQSGLQTWPR